MPCMPPRALAVALLLLAAGSLAPRSVAQYGAEEDGLVRALLLSIAQHLSLIHI